MPNALTRDVGFKIGPVLWEVLAKHYFERRKPDGNQEQPVKLRKDEILFDEAFTIVKSFLNIAVWHTVEDLQAFSNTRTPSPPWVKVVRMFVPMSSCDQAASLLIQVLGGEEFCRQLVGGIKWWQVRGVNGVDGQWIVAKKDWKEAKRRDKQRRESQPPQERKESTSTSGEEDNETYNKDMDAMRCILFLHGGGYYFGSVDQERYSIQRLARKINGRVFAINYRLAPQYPFPCALQDALAAYLYLIRPPIDCPHKPVDPAHIVIAGDSAGGGLSLALLQVIRDTGLPAPAGGLLISPWCDLTHSFPSIHTNTVTDVIPDCGLSFHKPSTLWPPPSEEVSSRVHASLRQRVQHAFKFDDDTPPFDEAATLIPKQDATVAPPNLYPGQQVNVGSTTNLPPVDPQHSIRSRKISLTTESNEKLEINRQIHFYAENSLITHPLISASLSYLGGLPPLFFIAGDKEVLRDEVIYTAHKAANPEKYPIPERSKQLYPALRNLKPEDMKPSSVHLQVWDDAPHVLPILFSFTTPAKFCFRAMATFCKFVTNMPPSPPMASPTPFTSTTPEPILHDAMFTETPPSGPTRQSSLSPDQGGMGNLTRRFSSSMSRASTFIRHRSLSAVPTVNRSPESTLNGGELSPRPGTSQSRFESPPVSASLPPPPRQPLSASTDTDVGGPRFTLSAPHVHTPGEHFAGEPSTYSHVKDVKNWDCGMIRERVGIDGVIRPLEPEEALDATTVPVDIIGKMSERTMRRCIDFQDRFDKKFAHTYKHVEKHRKRNLERSKKDTIKQLSQLRNTILSQGTKSSGSGEPSEQKKPGSDESYKQFLLSSSGWGWAWALDEHERPPPSSIVSRRDTDEARKLAAVADLSLGGADSTFTGNNLWSVVVNFLTITPGKSRLAKSPSREPKASPKKQSSLFKLPKFKFGSEPQQHKAVGEEPTG
ncbi:hypothetical protein D9611_000275 [Ephemerocybe angulata]|uniref:Alpha/beta hydrolase fold-3 domain-containing protein n=1 Tax=Ephemerocybe angulata TaxID=980116 RepID=A0A8H5F812_9AGAR|nr:hypothetical protein D9611_000275 [Tulosesus angulatus]